MHRRARAEDRSFLVMGDSVFWRIRLGLLLFPTFLMIFGVLDSRVLLMWKGRMFDAVDIFRNPCMTTPSLILRILLVHKFLEGRKVGSPLPFLASRPGQMNWTLGHRPQEFWTCSEFQACSVCINAAVAGLRMARKNTTRR